jgi:hypothetical protein
MQNRQRAVWWLATALLFIVGFLLVLRVNHRGWLFVILGAVFLGALTATDRGLAVSHPRLARWALAGIALLLLLLVVIVGVVWGT